jgi:hypothetical protein
MDEEFKMISRYSRADAIADGVLVDVTATAKEAGITFPTAVTQAVFEKYVRVPEGLNDQDEAGRLWDIVFLLHIAIRQAAENTDSLHFTVAVKQHQSAGPVPASLRALCHPGDEGEPVITILLPDED